MTTHVIHPTAVYDLASLQEALGLSKTGLHREVRRGNLRIGARSGKYWVLGQWVIDWLESAPRHNGQKGRKGLRGRKAARATMTNGTGH